MTEKQYEIRFNSNGKPSGSVMVSARDSAAAKRLALGEIQGRPGYSDKKITITSTHEIR